MTDNETIPPTSETGGMTIPRMAPGRPSKEDKERYALDMEAFAKKVLELQARIPRKVSARGWCYLLEGMKVITKGQFDQVEKAMNDCRKDGLLPLDFVEADESRRFHHREPIRIETEGPRDYLRAKLEYLQKADEGKDDVAYWENQGCYLEMMVEKRDLLNLFSDTCSKYHVSIANAKGWSDLISRGELAERFKEAEGLGLKPVLLYYGDFDVGGLQIAEQLRSNMKDIEKATGYDPANLTIDHFGLSYDFIEKHGLTWIDNLESGSGRAPDKNKRHVAEYIARYGERKCEANAVLVRETEVLALLETTIKKYLPNPFEAYDKAVAKARDEVSALMDTLHVKESLRGWIAELGKEGPKREPASKELVGMLQKSIHVAEKDGTPGPPAAKDADDDGFVFDDDDDPLSND